MSCFDHDDKVLTEPRAEKALGELKLFSRVVVLIINVIEMALSRNMLCIGILPSTRNSSAQL